LRGVPVGKVSLIGFDWNLYPGATSGCIVVRFEVDQKILPHQSDEKTEALVEHAVKRGLRAIVKGQGITGTSILALEYMDPDQFPPPPLSYTPHYLYIPSAPSQFTRLLESIESSLRDIHEINFSAIGSGVTNTLAGIHELTGKLNDMDLHAIGTNTEILIVQLQSTVAEINRTIKGMDLDKAGHNAAELLAGLRESNAKLQIVLDKAATAPLQDAIVDIRAAVVTLNDVLLELKRYPSGFIFGEPPPRAKSVQPPSK
jgi:paraquat-inducible protein B